MTDDLATPPAPEPTPDPAPEATTRRRVGRKALVGGIAAAVVAGGGLGAYAVYDRLDGGGTQPHDVLPASTQVYARLDLDPSASQKIELFKLVRKFPDVAKDLGIKDADQDVRRLVFSQLVDPECPDLAYEDDIEPWLGERIGVGGNIADETFEVAVQTTNEDAARAGIKKLFACADEDYGIAFLDGYAIVSDSQGTVDDAVKAVAKGTLGEKASFVDDFEALGDQGVASAWVDVAAIADDPDLAEAAGTDVESLAKAGSAATTLRVDGDTLELAALSGRVSDDDTAEGVLGRLPTGTVAALSVAGFGNDVEKAFDDAVEGFEGAFGGLLGVGLPVAYTDDPTALGDPLATAEPGVTDVTDDSGTGPGGAQDFIDEIEQETGLRLPDDLTTLFGDSLTLAVGGKNLGSLPELAGPDDVAGLDVALKLVSDQAAATDLVQRLAALAERAGITLVAAPTEDGAVLATNQDAADAVTDPDGSLGDDRTFRSVVPDADRATGGLFVDIGAIVDELRSSDAVPEADQDDLDELAKLSAFGVSTSRDADHDRLSVRLALRD